MFFCPRPMCVVFGVRLVSCLFPCMSCSYCRWACRMARATVWCELIFSTGFAKQNVDNHLICFVVCHCINDFCCSSWVHRHFYIWLASAHDFGLEIPGAELNFVIRQLCCVISHRSIWLCVLARVGRTKPPNNTQVLFLCR